QMDASRSHQRVERIVQNAHAALTRVARMEADYVLYLEDDLEFNRFIRHNLEAWMPVRHGEVTLASLFNPGVTALACDVGRHFMVADPQSMYGSQAYLISLPMVRHLLRHWYDVAAPLDIKIPEIARRL